MKQYLRKITLGLSLIILFSMTQAAAVGPAASVPFKGGADGEITGVTPGESGVLMTATAVGNATHLGKFTREENLLLNPNTGAFTGAVTFTAADGSQLTATLEGQFTSAATAVGTYTFTGGSGRFADASGSADFSAVLTDAAHFTVEFDGYLD